MNPTDILLSIAIVGIYTIIYVYLKSKYDDNKTIIKLFVVGFISDWFHICNNNYWYSILPNKIYSFLIKFI